MFHPLHLEEEDMEENDDYHKEFNEEFSKVLDELNLSPQTHENWKSGLN